MLQKLNERIQGVVAWVVIVLVAVTFTLFGIDYYLQSRHESTAEVEVNGIPITKQAFELNYRRVRQMRDPTLITAALENQLKQQVLDEMIMSSVSVQAAQTNGFNVSPVQANTAIMSIPQFQQDGHFSADRYQHALNGALFTPESFQREVSQGMLLNQQRFAFIGTSFALPSEIKQFVKLYMQTRDYDYLEIPVSQFAREMTVTPEEIATYYKQHAKDFLSHEQVTVDFVRVSIEDIKANIKLTDDKIKQYYQDNQSNFYMPAQWQVAHILYAFPENASEEDKARIKTKADEAYRQLEKNPEQFAQELKNSDDKLSVVNGGVLPWIVAGQSEFDKALVALTTSGQISSPILSQHGYEIFKLVDYKPAAIKPLLEVKSDIQRQLLADLAQAEYAQTLEKLSDLSYQAPDSLTPVADALHLKIEESEPFTRQGGSTELTKNKQIIQAAFSHDVLALGNNSEPLQLDNESAVVLRVNKHQKAIQQSLAQVKPQIVEQLTLNKATIKAEELGRSLLNLNQDLAQQEHLLTEKHLTWLSIADAARDGEPNHALINELAFSLGQVGIEDGKSLPNGDYVIVKLKKINDGKLELLDKEQVASITQQIEANYGMMDYDLYLGNLRNQAKIVKF